MEIAQLRAFDEVATRGSFAAAARALDLDPSAVSRAIAALERSLDVRLFERSTRRVALTEAGEGYHARIAPLLAELDAAGAQVRDLVARPSGRLRVSASTAFGQVVVLPMLEAFLEACPDLTVDLILSDTQLDLIEHRIDLAIRLAPEAPPDTIVSRLMGTRYRVVAAPRWAAEARPSAPADLADHPCVLFALPGFRDRWRFRLGGVETEVAVGGRIEITGALAVRDAARSGFGPALLADWLVAEDLQCGDLVDLFPDHEATATTFDTGAWLMSPSRAYRPLKTRLFIEALRAHVARR